MIDAHNLGDVLKSLQQLVKEDKFQFAPRNQRTKVPVTSKLAKIIVESLTKSNFEEYGLEHNHSGELVYIFISDDGVKYYIKFKFIKEDTEVFFISFHEAEY